ncbi:hypothetical protein NCPPB3778_73 [Rathayibacter phage NCPPB3778]|nr:hypothetical protein NCPPB3778_73 [Rathayibacter phage NCPPB3778]
MEENFYPITYQTDPALWSTILHIDLALEALEAVTSTIEDDRDPLYPILDGLKALRTSLKYYRRT